MKALASYIRGVRAEFAHIVWPSNRRAITDIIAIVVISVVTGLLIAGLDYGFTSAVNYIVSH
jgi:preprotein translocase subunit SecE